MTISQRLQSGLSQHQAGQLAEAESIYRQVLAEQPENPDALHLLGVLLGQTGKSDAGIEMIRRALEIRPNYVEALSNLGTLLFTSGNLPEALIQHRKAVELNPKFALAHLYLGNTLLATGKREEAIASFRQAIAINHHFAEALVNLGTALREKRQLDEAIELFQQAVVSQPRLAMAHGNLAAALAEVGRFSEAIAAFRQALSLKPDDAIVHSNLIFLQMFLPEFDAPMIREELARWNERHAKPLRLSIRPLANDRNPDRRLRIGYVSADFRNHVIGRNMLPLFRNHDRSQFEVFGYFNVVQGDELTAEFQKYSAAWRNIASLPNVPAADLIRQDKIDILVDLSLHTANHRLLIFAQKPAPVQATFAGYPGSTGLETIDYRLTDPYLDPPGQEDEFQFEKPLRLPNSFWCYEAGIDIAVNSLPAESNGYITFGCLNNFTKVNEDAVRLWGRVLKTVERSRMLLLCPEGSARRKVLETFGQEGIDASRIEFTANCSRPEYFRLYHNIDIGLDTFPYNGHTTSLDSYWMGVPVVTLVGQRIVGRAGLSQLTNLGLPELIARTPDEYVQIASNLAGDLPRLAQLRAMLRRRMEASPLMDARGFAHGIELAYRTMWKTYIG